MPALAHFKGNPPASRNTIEQVQEELGFRLPGGFVDFLLTSDGAEGFVGRSYLVIWRIEQLIAMNAAYHVAEFAPGLLLFGSNGGDEAFGFDTRSEVYEIITVPFVGIDLRIARTVAPDFDAFLAVLATS